MLSLEPATITGRQYPLLFQEGETAFGNPIADAQHPHNFFMELAALYDIKLGEHSCFLFTRPSRRSRDRPRRLCAPRIRFRDPLAALGHHQEDSTHISDDVVTAGFAYRFVRVEASGFHGRQPGENRWIISQGALDSWSMRLTVQPGKNWSGQYSYARIASVEALFPNENQERMTASIDYNLPIHDGNWSSTLLWGRTRSLQDGAVFNSYDFESTLQFRSKNYAWTRIEDAERSNELLIGESPLPPNFTEQPIGRVQAYTLGYDRDVNLIPRVASALGARFTLYGTPSVLQPIYGLHPLGVAIFLRLRPVPGKK